MSEKKFFVCSHCGNIIGMIHASGAPVVCCGEPMKELVPNTVDASGEKHLPVVQVNGNEVTVAVGSVAHPMADVHYIQWIYIQTKNGGQRKVLKPGDAPEAKFMLCDDELVAVYAYCNLHGLWMTDKF